LFQEPSGSSDGCFEFATGNEYDIQQFCAVERALKQPDASPIKGPSDRKVLAANIDQLRTNRISADIADPATDCGEVTHRQDQVDCRKCLPTSWQHGSS